MINRWVDEFGARVGVRVRRIRLSRNLGFTGGNNVAYRLVDRRSKYIALVNNDAVVLRDSLRRLVEFLEANSDVGAAQGIIINPRFRIDNAGAFLSEFLAPIPAYMGRQPNMVRRPFYATYVSGAYSVYRVEALHKAGLRDRLFDWEFLAYYDDNVLGLRLWQAGYKVVVLPFVAAIHVGSATFGRRSSWRYFHTTMGWAALNEFSNSRFRRINRLLILLYALRATLISLASGGFSKATPIHGYVAGLRIAKVKRDRFDIYRAPIPRFPAWTILASIILRRVLNWYLDRIDPQEAYGFLGKAQAPQPPEQTTR